MSLSSDPRWSEALGHLPDYLGNHVRVSVTALALGLLVSLPLAIFSRAVCCICAITESTFPMKSSSSALGE